MMRGFEIPVASIRVLPCRSLWCHEFNITRFLCWSYD